MKIPNLLAASLLTAGLFLSSCAQEQPGESMSPTQFAEHVSEVIVEGTEFSFEPALQHFEQDGAYLVDFPVEESGTYYARSVVKVEETGDQDFGTYFAISHQAGEIEVWLNGEIIYSNSSNEDGHFNHVDYGLFEFQDKVKVDITDRDYPLVISFTPEQEGEDRIYFSFIRSDNALPQPAVSLRSPSEDEVFEHYGYWWIGPFEGNQPEEDLMDPNLTAADLIAGEFEDGLRWDIPQLHLVKELPGWLTYQNWHYSGGTFLDAMRQVTQQFDGLDYSDYINRHMDFLLDNIDDIAQMREDYGVIESPFGHYFRASLLDDMGMQTVPYVNRLIEQKESIDQDSDEYKLAYRVSDYIMNDASRLPDGTFARFTPDSMSVWADDLYMGTVVLLKMYELTGEQKYLDEVTKQIIQFDEHLRDPSDNIYWHGWFSRNEEHSSTKWGRANGWTMMAKTELLLAMPEDYPQKEEILNIFRRQCEGLLAVQSEDGRWHQVLNDPDSYLETSATAMFVRAFATGVNQGWLSRDTYDESIRKGWNVLTKQINEEGDITGIVRGTPIMFSDEEYDNWGTRRSDPRGLGALLYASVAMDNYLNGAQ